MVIMYDIDDIFAFLGDNPEELAATLADIANDKYKVDLFKYQLQDYKENNE